MEPPAEFRARPPWLGGDLQTLRNIIAPAKISLSAWAEERVAFDMPDATGDRLTGALHRPLADAPKRPLAVVVHGLSGCLDGTHIRQSARVLLLAGYPVLRLNLRGAGSSRASCGGHYNAGASTDFAAVLEQLEGRWPDLVAPGMVGIGYSLGANILLKYMGETGGAARLAACVAVSPPIDLSVTSAYFLRRRNAIYHRWLLARIKAQTVAAGARVTPAERRAVAAARNIWQFDDKFVAPRFGYEGAEDYYARCSASRYLSAIERPTAVIHAADDPWIPSAIFRRFDWATAGAVTLELVPGGGHVGFHGVGSAFPWHDRYALAFFERKRV